jgi:hypothetical protein
MEDKRMDKDVNLYIEKQKSPQEEICRNLRKIIFKFFPGIREEMRWGVPTYANDKYYIVALKDHVNLGFSIKGLTKEEQKLFEGSGKTMMHIRIFSLQDIDEGKIFKFMKLIK